MSEHIKGPWVARVNHAVSAWENLWPMAVTGEGGRYVGAFYVAGKDEREAAANARLVIASTDLLAACKFVLPCIEMMPPPKLGETNWPLLAREIRAAIAKVEGIES